MRILPSAILKPKEYLSDRAGGVTVQTAFLSGFIIMLIGGSIEAGYAYWQYNNVSHAAHMGARIAATSNPVAYEMSTMTGLSNGVVAGDPMPDYMITCAGKTNSCTKGQMDQTALKRIVHGRDLDNKCEAAVKRLRGMCDLNEDISVSNVEVTYENSGFGTAGDPADIVPLITVSVKDMYFNFVFLDVFTKNSIVKMPDISVSIISEDMRSAI